MFKPYPKEDQIKAGTKEAKELLKRAFKKTKEIPSKGKSASSKLLDKAVRIFNAFIRKRDEGRPCISCGKYNKLQAGHFYAAGHFPHLRFHEDNVHGQCVRCNKYLHGNLNLYRIALMAKIGKERLEKLDVLAHARRESKNDRIYYAEIIEKYGKRL